MSQGDEDKHSIDDTVRSAQSRKMHPTEFSYLVDQIAKEITEKAGGIERAYMMISAEMRPDPFTTRCTPEDIARYHLGSRQVPASIYYAAKDILNMILRTSSGNGTRGKLYAWEKTPDAKEHLDRQLGYKLPEGEVPRFAFNAILKRVLEETYHDTVMRAARESANRGYCTMKEFKSAEASENDCPSGVYMATVNLLLRHIGMGEEHLKKVNEMEIHRPMHYNAGLRYVPGQMLVFMHDAGAVMDKRKDKILVAQYTGKHGEYIEREYVEGLQHDRIRNKFEMSGLTGVGNTTFNASVRRVPGAK